MFFLKARTDLKQVPVSPQDPFPVTIAGDSVTLTASVPDVRVNDTVINSATPSAAVTVATNNAQGVVSFTIAGLTASGATLTAEASDNIGAASPVWAAVNTVSPSSGVLSTTLTADGQYRVNAGGRTAVRLRVSSTGTGNITITSNASSVSSLTALSAPLPAGSNVIGGITAASGSFAAGSIGAAAIAAGAFVSGSILAGAMADGADTTQGLKADAAATDSTSSWTVVAILKGMLAQLLSTAAVLITRSDNSVNITTTATTLVKSGAGTFAKIVINKAVATGTITVYDSLTASGTVLATITMPAALLANQNSLAYDLAFAIGLTVVTGTAAQDITITYK